MRPILVSALLLACARGAVADDLVTTYGALFNDHVDIMFSGYSSGSNIQTNFPLLVRLSEGNPAGFTYKRVDKLGKDIRFLYYGLSGSDPVAVPYEVDTWNTNGVSLLWVKLPVLNNGSSRKLTMYWAPDDSSALPANVAHDVWSDYAAVWHMNSPVDSSANDIASVLGSAAAVGTGVIGSALVSPSDGSNGPFLSAPAGTAIDNVTTGAYTISGWVRVDSLGEGSPWFYSRRTPSADDAYGAEIVASGAGFGLKLYANASDVSQASSKAADLQTWVHLAIESKGPAGAHAIYKNGVKLLDWTASVTDLNGSAGFALGGLFGTGASGTLAGALDEVRVFAGSHAKAASWAKAEYEQVTNLEYLTFGTVSTTGKDVYPEEESGDDDPGTDDSGSGSDSTSDGSSSPDDFAGTAEIVPAADSIPSGVTLTNFVMLVKVWEGSPAGFVPSQLPFGTEDLRFFDERGNCLNYDLERWDENGDSIFWLKVPYLKASSRITMCWGLREGRTLPENVSTNVWSDYAGVWHMEDARDSTVWNAPGSFGKNATNRFDGAVGRAAQTKLTGANGAILDAEASSAVEALTNGTFTASGYVLLRTASTKYGYLFSRATADDPAWGARFSGGTSGDSSRIEMQAGASSASGAVSLALETWTRFDFVYAADKLTFYLNGEEKCSSSAARTLLGGTSGRLALGSLVSTSGLASGTLNGGIDEFRLRAGRPSANEIKAEREQVSLSTFYEKADSVWDETAILQNRWKTPPSLSKTVWKQGETAAEVDCGQPWHGVSSVKYVNRETAEELDEMPTEGGDYRAVFTVPQTSRYSSLVCEISFRIRTYKPTHDLGSENDRILLLNDDRSISDGLVEIQAYNYTAEGLDRPFWWHDVDSGSDYTSANAYYNYCGGTHHTYYGTDGARYWDLIDVRYGNTYNNADDVLRRTGEWEEWDEGLSPEMNYLPWNPKGGRLVVESGDLAEGWHEYAAQAVMRNTLKASINSGLYTNGIGTIYFDCVNSHTNDAPLGYYKLVVEYATNALDRATEKPYGVPTDENIQATHDELDPVSGEWIEVVHDAYRFADWKRLTMHVQLVKDGAVTTNCWTTDELELNLADGGTYKNFYRVYLPVDCSAASRFRIRRTAVNPEYTIIPDNQALILVDNVICSKPTDRISVEPRGFYDPLKIKRETVGYEGAFKPSYPSVNDDDVRARVRISNLSGGQPMKGSVSAIEMHYRWRYLDQQTTDWLSTDIDPLTLTSEKALALPGYSGDIEFWFEVNQSGEFYRYADYTGLDIGLPGYSEEVSSVTNRAATYETYGKDWFTRIRDGKSSCGNVKLFVRRGANAAEETVEMFLARDRVWRGCLLTTNAVADGVRYRFETRNVQDDSLADFQFNTNCWYLAEAQTSLPVSGKLEAGTTNDWSTVPCDAATGHLLFQIDDETRAVTIVHADWQDFNAWTDADTGTEGYFSGSSADDSKKKGTSVKRREYTWNTEDWDEDCATNAYWNESFTDQDYEAYSFYTPFASEESPNGFLVGEGMWVRGAYADASLLSGMALQMAGQGRGSIRLPESRVYPRGLESVKFNARIAQSVSPDQFSIFDDGARLNNYTFLTRAAFDRNGNSNFVGNASLSLAAFLRDKRGCYEARWEQLGGNIEKGSGKILGPVLRSQRLVIYRWRYSNQTWAATELIAATNVAGSSCSWRSDVCPVAIPATYDCTNNLMPFCIGAYNNASAKYTVVVAAVRIGGQQDLAANLKGGVSADAEFGYLNTAGWLYVVYRDTSADRLTSGTYGLLASNCEGLFVRPQYHQGIVSWTSAEATKTLNTGIHPKGSESYLTANFITRAATNCVADVIDEWWSENSGRLGAFYDTPYDNINGFTNQVPTQSINVFTAPRGTANWSLAASRTLTGFGAPGVLQDTVFDLWSTQDSSVKIAPGGELSDVRTDVVVDNIQISQWRGTNWFGTSSTEQRTGGLTNFVFTSGWVLEETLQLSAKRTPSGTPCSLRVPLCDGLGTGAAKRGLGLGDLTVEWRNATTNMRLQVQIITNHVSAATLKDVTLGFENWVTVTNLDFATMTASQRAHFVYNCSLGLHGVTGTMRILVDPTLVDEVKDVTDETAFGSLEIVSVLFRDEPPLDAGCWWGWNIRTLGDRYDSERRMYLPDNPYRTIPPALEEIGRSLALNNSITDDIDPEESGKSPNPYRDHMPFLQTPTFTNNIVGEVSFKARKYSLNKGSQNAEITLYGTPAKDPSASGVVEGVWEPIQIFFVSNVVYESYSFKINPGDGYRAFRFGVTGVDGVVDPGDEPTSGDEPVRVLIDDVLVSEAIRARLAFRNVGAFRHDLAKTTYVPNVPSTYEQPIVSEGWGVQAEVYAAMLGEEIDLTVPPRVRLHYYTGTYPWGYSQWKNRSDATSGWMSAATDTNLIYRSSYVDSPAAVIPMATSPNTVVQYMLEVVYTVVNPETGYRALTTNWLESADWQVPSWYSPVDYNATRGSSANFAAFAIIDEIAPGWAWINEANIFGAISGSSNTEDNHQYVEIVKPAEYDLKDWKIRMLTYRTGGSTPETATITTNTVATFGDGNVAKTKSTKHMAQNMTFMVVACPASEDKTLWRSSTEDVKDETLDGTWTFMTTDSSTFKTGGTIGYYAPFGVQLVRPTGIVEHEVVCIGTNKYATSGYLRERYEPTNLVNRLNVVDATKRFFFAGADDGGAANSLGVYDSRGEAAKWWNNSMKMTPGRINENQYINPDHPTPEGEMIIVFANVDTSFGHIYQTVGDGTNTTAAQMVSILRNSEAGTNITYTVDPWYELGTVTETEGSKARIPIIATNGVRRYTVNVAKKADRNVTVTASAAVAKNLRDLGLTEKNRYTPAVLNWLEKHTDAFGNDFYDWESGDIRLAKFLALSGSVVTNLTLTQMYWLDIDPTVGNMYFKAGMVRPPSPVVLEKPTYRAGEDMAVTNLRMGIYMSISNGNASADMHKNGLDVWAPYTLRGLGMGEMSKDYSTTNSPNAWTSVTFKVTGFLNNGLNQFSETYTDVSDGTVYYANLIPLRYFVFGTDSFDANFESEIDIEDPFTTHSLAYSYGWYDWAKKYGKPDVWFAWGLDSRLKQVSAEILAPTNRFYTIP